MSTTTKIIVHWLNYSRSQRIIWLLEELNVPFELKVYQRTKEFRAPKELEKIHPLGKSPVIEIFNTETNESEIIAETGHIINYILTNYDTNNKLNPTTSKGKNEVDYFLHYSEGTIQPLLVTLLVHSFAKQKAPFGTRFLMSLLVKGIDDQFYLPELLKNLTYLDSILKKQHEKGSEYFVGDSLSGADVILSFPLIVNIFENKNSMRSFGKDIDIVKTWPNLNRWVENVVKLPNYIKANELVAKYETVKPNI